MIAVKHHTMYRTVLPQHRVIGPEMSVVLRFRNSDLSSLADSYSLPRHLNVAMHLDSVIKPILSPYPPTSQDISFALIVLNRIYRPKTPNPRLLLWTMLHLSNCSFNLADTWIFLMPLEINITNWTNFSFISRNLLPYSSCLDK